MDDHVDRDELVIAASDEAKRLENKIRRIVDDRKISQSINHSKELLNLTVGTLARPYSFCNLLEVLGWTSLEFAIGISHGFVQTSYVTGRGILFRHKNITRLNLAAIL